MTKYFLALIISLLPMAASAATTVSLFDVAPVDPLTEGENFGWTVSGGGDVNNDGYEDFLVGAPAAGNNSEGHVYLFYGQAEKVAALTTAEAITFSGETDGDQFGGTVAWLGDINNDGFDDFAATSRYHDTSVQNPGTIYLFYGKAERYTNQNVANRSRFYGVAARNSAGSSVRGVGDINNDSFDDFVVSAPDNSTTHKGAIYLVYGKSTNFSATEDLDDYVSFTGERNFDYLGTALAGGDLNGDGYSDIAVSAVRFDNNGRDSGKVYIIPGKSALYTDTSITSFSGVLGETPGEQLGNSLAIANVTGDDYNDLVIAARYNDTEAEHGGAVYVITGDSTLPSSQLISTGIQVVSDTLSELMGNSIANAGDLNSDGYDDLLVGAPSELPPETGNAYVIYGGVNFSAHNVNTDFTLTGEEESSEVGHSVSTTDFNGDGIKDLLIGAPYFNSDAGRVYLGYWPIHTCETSAAVGGILANYPLTDWKYRKYVENRQYKIVVERHGKIAQVVNCYTDTVVQTLTFNTRAQRKILARIFSSHRDHMFIAVTRTFSKRKIKIFLYSESPTELTLVDTVIRKWRPRGLRIKLNKKNYVTLQRGKERKHRLTYKIESDFTLTPLQ